MTAVSVQDTDPVPTRAPEPDVVDVGGELLLVDPRTDGIHQLNVQGGAVWSVLDGEGTVGDLVADLADAFEVDDDVVREDVHALLDRLKGAGLLAGAPPPEHALVGAAPRAEDPEDGLWRPSYLFDPPAP